MHNDMHDECKYLILGKFGKSRGLKGELRLWFYSDDIDSVYNYSELFLAKDKDLQDISAISILAITPAPSSSSSDKICAWVKLKGIHTIEQARNINSHLLLVKKDALPLLDKGQYYWYQLEGLKVFSIGDNGEQQTLLGKVSYLFTNANIQIMAIEPTEDKKSKNKIYIPFIKNEVIKEVSLEESKILVHWNIN